MNYSNPRKFAEIDNWPYGTHRVRARFEIEESHGNKERAVRTTENPGGGWNNPKKRTYARKARIVDGDDGRIYIVELTEYGHISVQRGDMKYNFERIHMENPRFWAMLKLFD
jgi:hypothetical protein